MKLQKQLSRKTKDKTYFKWVIVLPSEQVKELGWKGGEELKVKVIDGNLTIGRKSKKEK